MSVESASESHPESCPYPVEHYLFRSLSIPSALKDLAGSLSTSDQSDLVSVVRSMY